MNDSAHCPRHGAYRALPVAFGINAGCPYCASAQLQLQNRAAAMLARIGIPELFEDAKMADLDPETHAQLSMWARTAGTARGSLLVSGSIGVGKSHAVCALAKLCAGKGLPTRYFTAGGLWNTIAATFRRDSGTSEDALMASLTGERVLIVDDVGAGTGSGSDPLRQRLHTLIEDRYKAKRPTVIVTNLSVEQLKEEIGERGVDRLRDDGSHLKMIGKSRRTRRQP